MIYLFRTLESNELVEVDMAMCELLERQSMNRIILDDGREARRDYAAEDERDGRERVERESRTGNPWRNFSSVGLACHPSQAKQFTEDARAAGLTGVHYDEKGRARFSSRGQRKKALKIAGLHDNDGGYGDG